MQGRPSLHGWCERGPSEAFWAAMITGGVLFLPIAPTVLKFEAIPGRFVCGASRNGGRSISTLNPYQLEAVGSLVMVSGSEWTSVKEFMILKG